MGGCLPHSLCLCPPGPVSAPGGLAWTVAKPRRVKQDFPGAQVILEQLKNGVSRRRVGLLSRGAPARGSTVVVNAQGEKVGVVTSGCPSPSLGKGINVSMAYMEKSSAKAGTELALQVRGRYSSDSHQDAVCTDQLFHRGEVKTLLQPIISPGCETLFAE